MSDGFCDMNAKRLDDGLECCDVVVGPDSVRTDLGAAV